MSLRSANLSALARLNMSSETSLLESTSDKFFDQGTSENRDVLKKHSYRVEYEEPINKSGRNYSVFS